MDNIYGWFGVTGPDLPGKMQQTFYHLDGDVAGQVAESAEGYCQWDAEQRLLRLSRTAEGALPLYYLCKHGQLLFSSHLPWLLSQLGASASAIDMNCLADLAIIGFVPAPRTQYRDVFQLPLAAQLQWRWGEAAPDLVLLAKSSVVPSAIGVTLRRRQGKTAPDVTPLSDNVMMYNAIPHCAAMLGESHGDTMLLRLSLHMRHQRAEIAHFRFESYQTDAEGSALQRLSVPWLKRRWWHRLHDYWQTTRVPEIARWFAAKETMSEAEWINALIASERQRIIHLMALAYHQQADFYYTAKETEQNVSVEPAQEEFSLNAPEAGSLFCHAVMLGKSSAKMNHYLTLSPDKLRREWGNKRNRQLIGMICAISSLDYLDGFYYRLPT